MRPRKFSEKDGKPKITIKKQKSKGAPLSTSRRPQRCAQDSKVNIVANHLAVEDSNTDSNLTLHAQFKPGLWTWSQCKECWRFYHSNNDQSAKCQQLHPGPEPLGTFGDSSPKPFVPFQILLCAEKIVFKHIINTKIFPPKNLFCPHTLKPGYGPGCATHQQVYSRQETQPRPES